jgi:hypothetical protein
MKLLVHACAGQKLAVQLRQATELTFTLKEIAEQKNEVKEA